ncbi:hypothetical protein YC2023_116281 [Brassica napus]
MALYKVSLMEYWFKQRKDEEAMEIYKVLDMSEQMNDIVGNRVLRVLVEHGKKTEAWELFDEIIGFCYPETFGIMMKSFSDEKTIPLSWASETCYRTIIACLCEQGKMSEAEEFFAKMFSNCEEEELMVGPDVSVGLCHQSPKLLSQTEGSNMLSEGKTLGPAEDSFRLEMIIESSQDYRMNPQHTTRKQGILMAEIVRNSSE